VEWLHRLNLSANDYNPNHVAPPERELLIVSILADGWTQPIVALPDLTIVDGFHRWEVSADPRLEARYQGFVPVVRVDFDPLHSRMSTIRHNRARGIHGVLPMSEIVGRMLKDGIAAKDIMAGLGMEGEEISRLASNVGMPELAATIDFTAEWVPRPKTAKRVLPARRLK
jgi:ParB-like chromosome segregation protein Spo0J